MTGALFISDDFHHLESCPRYVRTGQLGHGTPRRPEIIDDFSVYKWEEWHMFALSSHFPVVIPFFIFHSKAGCQVENWVSDTWRPRRKTISLHTSWTSQASTNWTDRFEKNFKTLPKSISRVVFWNQASEINCQNINFRCQSQPSALSTTSHLLKAFQVNHDFHQWGSTTLQLSIWNILHLWSSISF